MICPQCCGFDDLFNEKCATRELRRYRKRGPIKTTRLLIDALRSQGAEDSTLLDIGGGIGAIQHELIKDGATRVVSVEGSTASISAAREEATRQGYADRVQYHHADFVDVAEEIDSADIVTLDRVICCYPDMKVLVARSAEKARQLYGLVYPRHTWLVRIIGPAMNLIHRLRRIAFRVYLHRPSEIDRAVRAAGLRLRSEQHTMIWHVAVYARDD
ncbi:MAG: class I SAM-dependent methyltransferase [Phycisphaerales bacterium]